MKDDDYFGYDDLMPGPMFWAILIAILLGIVWGCSTYFEVPFYG